MCCPQNRRYISYLFIWSEWSWCLSMNYVVCFHADRGGGTNGGGGRVGVGESGPSRVYNEKLLCWWFTASDGQRKYSPHITSSLFLFLSLCLHPFYVYLYVSYVPISLYITSLADLYVMITVSLGIDSYAFFILPIPIPIYEVVPSCPLLNFLYVFHAILSLCTFSFSVST